MRLGLGIKLGLGLGLGLGLRSPLLQGPSEQRTSDGSPNRLSTSYLYSRSGLGVGIFVCLSREDGTLENKLKSQTATL